MFRGIVQDDCNRTESPWRPVARFELETKGAARDGRAAPFGKSSSTRCTQGSCAGLWNNKIVQSRRHVVRSFITSRSWSAYVVGGGVRRFELFGSAARDDFTPTSDLDFLVEFDSGASLERYLGLRDDMEALFGRSVDLVMPTAIRKPYIRAAIDRDRQLVYAA
jgi:uncharacterized protein